MRSASKSQTSAPAHSYRARIKLPIDLYTVEGTQLQAGQFEIEVRAERDGATLLFSVNKQVRATIAGHPAREDAGESGAVVPVFGTLFLRSSGEPELTDEERHYSKSGRPQYADESRDWKACLRAFRSPNPNDRSVVFLFAERADRGLWTETEFRLSLQAPAK